MSVCCFQQRISSFNSVGWLHNVVRHLNNLFISEWGYELRSAYCHCKNNLILVLAWWCNKQSILIKYMPISYSMYWYCQIISFFVYHQSDQLVPSCFGNCFRGLWINLGDHNWRIKICCYVQWSDLLNRIYWLLLINLFLRCFMSMSLYPLMALIT